MKLIRNLHKPRDNKQVFTCLAIFIVAFQAVPYSYAQSLVSWESELKKLEKSKKITVIVSSPAENGALVKREWERYRGNSVAVFRGLGCTFTSNKKLAITKLVQSLKKRQLASADYHHLPYASVVIYFDDGKGHEARLLLGRQYINEVTVDGEMQLPTDTSPIKVSINNEIYRDVFNWIARDAKQEVGPEVKGYYQPPSNKRWNLLQCNKLTKFNYYRNSPKQTCATLGFERMLPNECPSGWQPVVTN